LFIDKYHSYAKADDRPNKRIDLSNNFRSRPAILEFINDIFSAIMNEDLGEVAYDDSAKLIPGMDFSC
jgi:ATP-dependent exoDNAse (exonuclease V) beta subunit (contains helicase and exonuclease domains)